MRRTAIALAILGLTLASPAAAQARSDPTALQASQREAMTAFERMDGMWRGPAWSITPNGRHDIVQTERIGPFLGGTVRVVEGRGYNSDGNVGFNALGVISFNPATRAYTISSWARGYNGVFPIRPTEDGYIWETPAGPGAIVRYTATIRDGTLREIGERIAGEAPPVRIFEMNLRRIGDSAWPAGDPVPMR